MRRKSFISAAAVFGIAIVCIYVGYQRLLSQLITAHQQSTTKEIAAWGETYSRIRSADDAARAADMVEYIRNYYVVAPGYRSDSQTEAALESQRRKTIEQINAALGKYEESGASSD